MQSIDALDDMTANLLWSGLEFPQVSSRSANARLQPSVAANFDIHK
jgi:hypothetical protein